MCIVCVDMKMLHKNFMSKNMKLYRLVTNFNIIFNCDGEKANYHQKREPTIY